MISYSGNAVTGLDFNQLGTLTASIDNCGECLISDMDTGDYSCHLQISSKFSNLSNYLSLHTVIEICFLFSTN